MGKRTKTSDAADLRKGLGCLIAFALPFALIGAGTAGAVIVDLWSWSAAQSWVATPALLLESKLDVHHDEGATYAATARYKYDFRGRTFESRQVALQGGHDNVGSYQRDRAAELEQILAAGGKLTCYVDPADPQRAVLFRDLRLSLLVFKGVFALVFGGVGFGLLAGAIYGRRRVTQTEQLQKAHPGEPWRWRDDWAAGRIRSSDGFLPWFVGFFAVAWNAMCWPIVGLAWNDVGHDGGPPKFLLALFPAAGAFVAVWAAYLWLRRLRWGTSEFEMAAVPGVLGGPLAGVIHAPGGIVAEEGFVLRLSCQKSVVTQSGGKSSTETNTLWDAETTLLRDLATDQGRRTLIPVKFVVPYDLPPSGDDVKWVVEARAETVGVDYLATFEVPVFRTQASRRDAAKIEDDALPDDNALARTVARLGGVLEEELAASRAIEFPAGRNRGMAMFLAMFTLVWGAVAYGLFVSPAPRIIAWVVALFGVLPLYGFVSSCLSSTRLEYGTWGVATTHRWLGVGRRREVTRDQIASIDADRSGTTYNGREYRRIYLENRDKRRETLISELGRQEEAERLAADLRNIVGLAESRTADGSSRMPLDAELPGDLRGE